MTQQAQPMQQTLSKADVTTISEMTGFSRDYVYRVLVKRTRNSKAIEYAASEVLRMKQQFAKKAMPKGRRTASNTPCPSSAN